MAVAIPETFENSVLTSIPSIVTPDDNPKVKLFIVAASNLPAVVVALELSAVFMRVVVKFVHVRE